MEKGKLVFIFVIVMLMISSFSSLAAGEAIEVSIDGEYVKYSDVTGYPFIDENNYIQVPLSVTLEEFERIIGLQNDSGIISTNSGTEPTISSGAVAVIRNNRVHVPIRMLMEMFKCDINWNSAEKIVEINSRTPIGEESSKKPKVKIEAPKETEEDKATIEIITDKDNSIFLNGERIEVNDKNKYVVDLVEGDNVIKLEVMNQYGKKTEEYFMIERTKAKVYLDISTPFGKTVRKNRALIEGRTNPKNEVRINNKKIKIDRHGSFSYTFRGLEVGENNIIVSAKNKEFNKTIEEHVKINYRLKKDEEEDKDDFDEKQVRENKDVAKPDGDLDADPPVIKLDNEIPKTIDRDSFTISGICTKANYIVINTPLNQSGRIKLKDDGKFSLKAQLFTGENGGTQSAKGVYNYIQIFAVNEDKITAYEYIVYYKESDGDKE